MTDVEWSKRDSANLGLDTPVDVGTTDARNGQALLPSPTICPTRRDC